MNDTCTVGYIYICIYIIRFVSRYGKNDTFIGSDPRTVRYALVIKSCYVTIHKVYFLELLSVNILYKPGLIDDVQMNINKYFHDTTSLLDDDYSFNVNLSHPTERVGRQAN